MSARFGPAGNAADFPYKTSEKAPGWIAQQGLDCYEYQCGKGVHIGEETQSEQLPVLDFKNKAVPFETVDSAAVNKAIKRCLTKNLALFVLVLSLWNGEELSDNAKEAKGELTAINKETLSIATEKASKSEKAKKAVGDLVAQFVASKNVMSIKDIDKAKELNKLIKEL